MAVSITTPGTDDKACGAWSVQIVALDPICVPAAGADVTSGLKVVFKGSQTGAACAATKTCAGFCVADGSSTTQRAFCWIGTVGADVKVLAAANSVGVLTEYANFNTDDAKPIGPWTTDKNFEWIGLAYEGESNVESDADKT